MIIALTNLPDMRCAHLVGVVSIVLNFVIFSHCILFQYHLHYLIGKTFTGSQGHISFHKLDPCIFSQVHQAARL